MNADEFRIKGKEAIDFVADYLENIDKRRVTPDVEPGYLRDLLPKQAPNQGEPWEEIFKDFENKIIPGITHWQHPRFHAYFPAGNCYPSIIAELLSAGIGVVGFSWAASPSCTELETICLDWLGRMIDLPKQFLPFGYEIETKKKDQQQASSSSSQANDSVFNGKNDQYEETVAENNKPLGGGVLLGSASECVLVSLLSARAEILHRLKAQHPFVEDGILLSKLVMYTSKLAHSCVEKAGMIAMVKIRLLETDEHFSMRGHTVEKAIKEDRSNGFIPFFVSCTIGTTSCCSFDNLVEIGPVCAREDIYLHVDGAYAGNAMICEELRPHFKGIEYMDSFNFNPNKWMLINFDCSCLWVKDKYKLTKALSVDPIYLRYKEMDKAIDYRHWGIALSRRFRALKIWFTIRSYGVDGLKSYIREHIRLAKKFEQYILSDTRFEILGQVTLGLVCFRLKGPNLLSQNLLFTLNDSGKIHMVPAMLDDKYVIRFCVNAQNACDDDMMAAWQLIRTHADQVLKQYKLEHEDSLPETEEIDESGCGGGDEDEEGHHGLPPLDQVTSQVRRMRFGISKMVSEPRLHHPTKSRKYKRTATTFRMDAGKYLARKCSIVESSEDDYI